MSAYVAFLKMDPLDGEQSLLGYKLGIHTKLGTAIGIVSLENNKYKIEIT